MSDYPATPPPPYNIDSQVNPPDKQTGSYTGPPPHPAQQYPPPLQQSQYPGISKGCITEYEGVFITGSLSVSLNDWVIVSLNDWVILSLNLN